jgi:alpha-soluble NSF attachment protein
VEKDHDEVAQHIKRYEDMDVTFADTREDRLLWAIVDAFDKRDVEVFSTAVSEYDRVSRLDDWKVSILLHIRKRVEESEPDLL